MLLQLLHQTVLLLLRLLANQQLVYRVIIGSLQQLNLLVGLDIGQLRTKVAAVVVVVQTKLFKFILDLQRLLDPELESRASGLVGVGEAEYVTTELLTDDLADVEAYADSFWVQMAIGFQGSEGLEELLLVFMADTGAHVLHYH